MTRAILAGALLALLAACGGKGEGGDARPTMSAREVAGEMANAVRPEPGRYRTRVTVEEISMPGAPAGVADAIKQSMGRARTSEYCLTPEDAAKGYEEMARRSQQGNCQFDHFDADNGTIDAAMTCAMPQGGKAHMTINGHGTSTSSDMRMSMKMAAANFGTMTMQTHVQSDRIGPCS